MNRIVILIFVVFLIYFIFQKRNVENFEANKVATETDRKRAIKYALENLCKSRGYTWFQGSDEFVFDCKHTKSTCLRDSVYPTKEGNIPRYYEWREYGSDDAKKAGYYGVNDTSDMTRILSSQIGLSANTIREVDINNKELGGVCIMGNEQFRDFCEKEDLRYDTTNGTCYTTQKYCDKRLVPFCNGDCFDDPGALVLKGLFGDTLGRTMGVNLPGFRETYLLTQAACRVDTEVKKDKK